MLFRILIAKVAVAKIAVTAAFTLGVVAGGCAVLGACGVRKAMAAREPRESGPPAT
jgi:hypothetical protein